MLSAAALLSVAFTMPLVDLSARRLILVTPGPTKPVAAHVVENHVDDIRFLLTSSDELAVKLADVIEQQVTPKIIGRLTTSQSDSLKALADGEEYKDCAERSLQARDYVLRGTLPGAASVIVADEDVVQFILARAKQLKGELSITRGSLPAGTVCVLDFDDACFPDVRARCNCNFPGALLH